MTSQTRPEGGGTPRRMRYTLRGSDDRERSMAKLVGTASSVAAELELILVNQAMNRLSIDLSDFGRL